MDPGIAAKLELVLACMFAAGLVSLAGFSVRAFRSPDRWIESAHLLSWRPFTVRHLLRIVAFLAVLQIAFAGVAGLCGLAVAPGSTAGLVASTLLLHWAGLGAVLWLVRQRGWSLRTAFGGSRLRTALQVSTGILGYLALLPVVALVSWMTMRFIQIWNQSGLPFISNRDQMILEFFKSGDVFRLGYSLFTAVILAPVAEEILFRGVALPALARRVGVLQASMWVSLLFAGIHFHVAGFPVLFTLGLTLALAYVRTASLLVPIVLHMTFNLVTIVIFNLRAGE